MDYDFLPTTQNTIPIMQCRSCGHEENIKTEVNETE